MIKTILNIILILSFFVFGDVFSQDVHLSQFFNNDHYLNPSKIGDHEGDFRITSNYRSQWRQVTGDALTTSMVAFDKSFFYFTHEFDGGVYFVRDQFSGYKTNVTSFLVSGAYTYRIKGYKIRAGIQTGLVSKSTNLHDQTFPAQWEYSSGTFDKSIYNQESNINPSQMFWDLNLGFKSEKRFGKYLTHFGLAFNHLNRPKDTYFNQFAERLRVRKVVHGDIDIPLNNRWLLSPKFSWMFTTKVNELLIGSNINYKTNNAIISKLYTGVFYRHGIVRNVDAIYPVAGLTYKQFDLAVSYDVNISSLSLYVKRLKSVEFSLIYTAKSKKMKYKIIPCNRL